MKLSRLGKRSCAGYLAKNVLTKSIPKLVQEIEREKVHETAFGRLARLVQNQHWGGRVYDNKKPTSRKTKKTRPHGAPAWKHSRKTDLTRKLLSKGARDIERVTTPSKMKLPSKKEPCVSHEWENSVYLNQILKEGTRGMQVG